MYKAVLKDAKAALASRSSAGFAERVANISSSVVAVDDLGHGERTCSTKLDWLARISSTMRIPMQD